MASARCLSICRTPYSLDGLFLGTVNSIQYYCTVDGQKSSPLLGPFKGINNEIKGCFSNSYLKNQVLKLRLLDFSRGPGGFRELREAGRNHFDLSWYLSVSVVTSCPKTLGVIFLPGTVRFFTDYLIGSI